MIKSFTFLLLIIATATAGAGTGKTASSAISDSTGKPVGTATFAEKGGGVEIKVNVSGLPPGKHGIHLHETGKCDPPAFTTAGSHFNPTGKHHGAGNPEGKHAGDLPNLEVKADGTAQLTAIADGATMGKGKTSLLAKGGTALIIHQGPDDEKSDPTGNSGGRIACGVVVAQ